MAIAVRGGTDAIGGVIFHIDRGSTYTAGDFTNLCRSNGICQSMGRVGSCFDNADAKAFFSSLEWEVLSRHQFTDPDHGQQVVAESHARVISHRRGRGHARSARHPNQPSMGAAPS